MWETSNQIIRSLASTIIKQAKIVYPAEPADSKTCDFIGLSSITQAAGGRHI